MASDHLRSVVEITNYQIAASDGAIGHVKDFMIDTQIWRILQVLVDTRNFLAGKHVLVPADAIARIDWLDCAVYLRLSRQAVEESPEYAG